MTQSPKLLREHAEALARLAEAAGAEDRACLLAAAHDWRRIADKLDRVEESRKYAPRAHALRS